MKQLLLTEQEAADRLRVCARTLRRARQEGELRYVLIGRSVRYTVEDLESYIDSLRRMELQCPPSPVITRRSPGKRRRDAEIIPFTARQRG